MKKKIERSPIKETIELPCMLTNDELIKCGKTQSEAISKIKRLEDELESYKTQKKADITLCESVIQATSDMINAGKVFRQVECEIRWNFERMVKTWCRLDTGEQFRESKIPDHEMQENMSV